MAGGQVLATDGVWDNVYEEDMTRIVQVPPPPTTPARPHPLMTRGARV